MGPLGENLREEFKFAGPLGGEEYELLPEWQKAISDQLLEASMEYRIAKHHYRKATDHAKEYIKYSQKVVSRDWQMIPISTNFDDVPAHFNNVLNIRLKIENLIKIYNSGEK